MDVSLHTDEYEWYRGNELAIRKPWVDQDVITFKDPNRSAIEPRSDGPAADDGESGSDGTNGTDASRSEDTGATGGQGTSKKTTPSGQSPRRTTSTRTSSGKTNIIITIGNHTFGYSVDARITEDALQKITGHGLRMTSEGYWVAMVTLADFVLRIIF
jgi:hypothetical protein